MDGDFLADFPGLAGRTYLNTAAESLFMASHEATLLRYAGRRRAASGAGVRSKAADREIRAGRVRPMGGLIANT